MTWMCRVRPGYSPGTRHHGGELEAAVAVGELEAAQAKALVVVDAVSVGLPEVEQGGGVRLALG
jgi:hypothetical protein